MKPETTSWLNVHIAEMTTTKRLRLNVTAKHSSSTASNARFTSWRRNAIIAAAASSVTAWRAAAKCFAAPIARVKAARKPCVIVVSDGRRRERLAFPENQHGVYLKKQLLAEMEESD